MRIIVTHTKDPKEACDYSLRKVKEMKAVETSSNIPFTARKDLNGFFNYYADLNTDRRIKTFASHIKISWHPLDELSTLTKRKINEQVLEGLGYSKSPFITWEHFDALSLTPHLHTVTARVDEDGILIRDSFYKLKSRKLSNKLEPEYSLIPAEGRLDNFWGIRQPGYLERKLNHDKGFKSVHDTMRYEIFEALKGATSLQVFLRRLERQGVQLWLTQIITNGKENIGVSYAMSQAKRIAFHERHPPEKIWLAPLNSINMEQLSIHHQTTINVEIAGYSEMYRGVVRFNESNVPELCPDDTRLRDFDVAHAKASQLGPIFKWNNIKAIVNEYDLDLIKQITVRDKNYSRPYVVDNNCPNQKLIVAIEKRMAGGVLEAVREGASLMDLDLIKEGLSDVDIKWAKEVINLNQEMEQSALLKKMITQYNNEYGHNPNAMTYLFALNFSKGAYEKCHSLVKKDSPVRKRPDPGIVAKFLNYLDNGEDVARFQILIGQFNRLRKEAEIEEEEHFKKRYLKVDKKRDVRSLLRDFEERIKDDAKSNVARNHSIVDDPIDHGLDNKKNSPSQLKSSEDIDKDSDDQDFNKKRGIGY